MNAFNFDDTMRVYLMVEKEISQRVIYKIWLHYLLKER